MKWIFTSAGQHKDFFISVGGGVYQRHGVAGKILPKNELTQRSITSRHPNPAPAFGEPIFSAMAMTHPPDFSDHKHF
ncbi:hypothetical protein ACFGVS_10725 [Mucilaginibacter sp. AW1-7]|uniref:hypothetical protein n=1 Tax=Mucilaginibacter sp. AW1-7 TaxID=3349874 RepID=UPI003F736869